MSTENVSELRRQSIRELIADTVCGGDFNDADRLISRIYDAGLDFVHAAATTPHEGPWPFVLMRDEDVSGVSGTGVVAEGVEFTGGTVALRWLSEWPTSMVFHDRGIESVNAVHGHGGKTRIEWR